MLRVHPSQSCQTLLLSTPRLSAREAKLRPAVMIVTAAPRPHAADQAPLRSRGSRRPDALHPSGPGAWASAAGPIRAPRTAHRGVHLHGLPSLSRQHTVHTLRVVEPCPSHCAPRGAGRAAHTARCTRCCPLHGRSARAGLAQLVFLAVRGGQVASAIEATRPGRVPKFYSVC